MLIGEDAIARTLAGLPLSLAKPRVRFDLVVSFDMVLYGTSAHDRPGCMLVCYIDPTGPVPVPEAGTGMDAKGEGEEGEGKQRLVCEMQFVLQRRASPPEPEDSSR